MKRAYSDKSFVTMEQHVCLVCGQPYDTGALLLDKRMRDVFEKHTLTGNGLCPEHQKLHDDGYVCLIECDEKKSRISGNRIKPGDEYRTGVTIHIRRTVAREIFNVDIPDNQPLMFIPPEVTKMLQGMMPEGGDKDGNEDSQTQS